MSTCSFERFSSRWSVILAVLIALAPCMCFARQPNIVLVLIDDMGWPHLGCYGATYYESPQIDAVAAGGCRFTNFYAAGAVCSPTRASIQSGQYQARLGITDFIPGHSHPYAKLKVPAVQAELPLDVETPAEALQKLGYATGYFGKWHLGGVDHEPHVQGYDESIVTSGRHFGFRTSPPQKTVTGEYLADFLTNQTVEFIRRHRDQPFFVQISHFAVHIPLEAKPEAIRHFEEKTKPDSLLAHPTYAAMVKHVDDSIGRIIKSLKDLKLEQETLLVITSDNGGLRQSANGGMQISENSPLRNEKGSLYEGGIRVPLIIRWPGHVTEGAVCEEPTISIDFWPTFLDVAGGNVSAVNHPLDGLSLLPLFSDATARLDRNAIYFHYPHYHHSTPAGAIRSGDWKLIEFFETGQVELYHLSDDIGETEDLASVNPDLAAKLQKQLAQWRTSVNARMPVPNPEFDAAREHEMSRRKGKGEGE